MRMAFAKNFLTAKPLDKHWIKPINRAIRLSVKKNILFIDIFAIYVGRSGAEKFYLCSHGVDDFDSV